MVDDLAAGGVSILVEPNGHNGAELIAAIDAANKSVHVTMYMLTSHEVLGAIIAAHARGLDVKVVLNEHFAFSTPGESPNSLAFAALTSAKVSVAWASPHFAYTHEKCVLLDGKVAWIMTMNASISGPMHNREYLVIDTIPADVAEAEAIFAADFAGKPIVASGALVVAPDNAKLKIMTLIASAKHTLDVEGEEFSDHDVARGLIAAVAKGVQVRLVVANAPGNLPAANPSVAMVKAAGGKVYVSGAPSSGHSGLGPYIHAKVVLADGSAAYIGSVNFSTGSMTRNRELGVIVTNVQELAKVEVAIAADIAAGHLL
jgi:phosphatidylserine/phosphatidylglycerophosphate/cardiolipin synthase-like enzyme